MKGHYSTYPYTIPQGDCTWAPGISIRDYIAAMAMQGLLANAADKLSNEQIADMAYDQADKMILRSQKSEGDK